MKIKRTKTNKKTMLFYRTNFQITEPYHVLVDGNFIQAALDSKIFIKDHLVSLFQGKAYPAVSRCIVAELRALGKVFSGAVVVAKRFRFLKCEHETPVPAAECIKSFIGTGNEQKYCVASQDGALRRTFSSLGCVPLCYVSHMRVMLETPSSDARRVISQIEDAKAAPSVSEVKQLEQVAPTRTFKKRKLPAAPNPLSSLKKKKTKTTSNTKAVDTAKPSDLEGEAGAEGGKRRKRVRVRRKKAEVEDG